MGIFDRWRSDDAEPSLEPPSTVDADTGLDFSSYELDALGADIRSIVDLPGAIAQIAKYAFTVPFVVAIVTWIVFTNRMSTWALIPFTLIAMGLAAIAAAVFGGYMLARKRLDTVSVASGRVVEVIGEMHADVEAIRDGHSRTSVQQVAIGLLENAIFPAVFGTIAATAENTLGPFARFSQSITKMPMNMVQRSVVSAIKSLPDREIGQVVDDIGEALPAAQSSVDKISTEYHRIVERIDGTVAVVSRTALTSTFGLAAFATLPLLFWFVLGWIFS